MITPAALGVGVVIGAVLVLLVEAVVLWLHVKRAEQNSTRSSFLGLDPDTTQPIPVIDRGGRPEIAVRPTATTRRRS